MEEERWHETDAGLSVSTKLRSQAIIQQHTLTFRSASSWNSFTRLYIVKLLNKYLSLRNAKLFVGPSAMTPNTYSRSKKYSRISGMSKTGLLSSFHANKLRDDQNLFEMRTCLFIINLVDTFFIQRKRPSLMETRNGARFEIKFVTLPCRPISADYSFIFPMPMRRWGFWINPPRFEVFGIEFGLGRQEGVGANARHICVVFRKGLKVTIMVSRIISESLQRFRHIFITQFQAFLQRLTELSELNGDF